MSNMVSIIVGDDIPVVLFLQGRDIDLFPQAVIRQADGTLVDTVDLDHQANGVYVNSGAAVAMPDTPFVTVQYTVYTNAGRTTESARYEVSIDTFAVLMKPITDKTDQLNFTVADFLDVNLKRHNDQIEYGTGTPGDPWRGYP